MIYLNGEQIQIEHFSNKETRLDGSQLKTSSQNFNLRLVYKSDEDLLHLMFIKSHIDWFCSRWYYKPLVVLDVGYMPYSRQDRVHDDNEVFTLKYVANFINSLNFDQVWVGEAHSDVCLALLDRCRSYSIVEERIDEVVSLANLDPITDVLVFPDAGAAKRYETLAEDRDFKSLVGIKSRDSKTHRISSLELHIPDNFVVVDNSTALIVDDICSYGGTFIKMAEELKKVGFKKVLLFVAHTEESIYKGDIFKWPRTIDHVYITDSLGDQFISNPSFMTVLMTRR